MPVSITANTSARYAQASLNRQNDAVTAGTLRLSSGSRVLSAADDASSMAIGSSLRIENAGISSAILNATSGTSMLQIADGAMGQVSELMNRMQVLAVQASSGQYDDASRVLLNGEFQGLKAEIERLAGATVFNNVKVIAGTKDFDLGQGSVNGIKDIRIDPNVVTDSRSMRYSYDASTETLTMTRTDTTTVPAPSQSINLTALLNGTVGVGGNLQNQQTLEVGFSLMGVTLTLGAGFNRNADITTGAVTTPAGLATSTFTPATGSIPSTTLDNLLMAGVFSNTTGALTVPVTSDGTNLVLGALPGISYGAGPVNTDSTGITAGGTMDVYLNYTDEDGNPAQTLLGTLSPTALGAGVGTMALGVGVGMLTATETGDIAPAHLTYKVGTGIAAGIDTIGVDIPAMTLKALGLDMLDIGTQDNANASILALQSAQDTLNQGRAAVGAQQLRMEAVARNLSVIRENNDAARSSLIDVDVSKEITDITSNQAMMQASIAMLGRANTVPEMLLKLLQ